jgi:flavorubredoxin
MHAIVVYESHYGNTAAIAQAIAEGIGPDAQAMSTSEATPAVVGDADLVVAGSPVMAFNLPTDRMLTSLTTDTKAPRPPDLSHFSLRAWLEALPPSHAAAASFETRLKWSPGGATGAIEGKLRKAGFRTIAKGEKFVVTTSYGPLREGELDRARAWGRELASAIH